jgi:hypothetical protein
MANSAGRMPALHCYLGGHPLHSLREIDVKHKTLAMALLALALVAPGLHAQTAPATGAVNPASIPALTDMGAHLQSLKRFQVSTELTGERVLADGQKLQHAAAANIDVQRPGMLRARMASSRSEREVFFDGKKATLYTPAQKYYSTVEFSGNISELVGKLAERYGLEIPLSDLFLWGTPDAPLDKIESAMNAGQDFIGDDLCDHYAFRQGNVDGQIWITTGSKPLPRKLVITNRSDDARPQSVSLIDWNLKPSFKDSVFKFTPPKGATAVELRSLEKSKGE